MLPVSVRTAGELLDDVTQLGEQDLLHGESTAFGDPGRQTTSFPSITPAVARLMIAEVPMSW